MLVNLSKLIINVISVLCCQSSAPPSEKSERRPAERYETILNRKISKPGDPKLH